MKRATPSPSPFVTSNSLICAYLILNTFSHFMVVHMNISMKNFICSTLIPELCADVSAGSARHVHLILIAVVAVGAFPNELAVFFHDSDLAVESAYLTVVALGVQLGIHDVVVDKLDDLQHSGQVVLHIGHFQISLPLSSAISISPSQPQT